LVNINGKHTIDNEQHESRTHTEVLDVQVYVVV